MVDDPPESGLSRRSFLKTGAAGVAAGAVLGVEAGTALAVPPGVIAGKTDLVLKVNGEARKVRVEPRTTLAEALRAQLDLTGTKIGCDRGACSACTVHLDGVAALACMTLAVDAADRAITTIEGLAKGDALHPVQAAFVEHDATQCGYCTPGMVMTCAALVARDPKPTLPVIRKAVAGNLCRCGTYPKVFAAVQTATGQTPAGWPLETRGPKPTPVGDGGPLVGLGTGALVAETRDFGSSVARPWPPNASLAVVGKPTPRIDGRAKVTGAARYTADVYLPGMLYARRVVSPHPHAIVKRVDTSKASKLKGVRAVHVVKVQEGATLADPSLEKSGKFPRIRYAGQCVAAVAATTPSIADEAARLVVVEYDVLPHVADIDQAMRDDAPRVYPGLVDQGGSAGGGGGARGLPQRGNIRGPSEQKLGDVDAGMGTAKHVIRRMYRTQVQTHSAMEPHGVVADWKPGRLTVYSSTQGTATVRDELATVFKLPKSKVRVVSEFMGGGFGAKFGAGHYGVVAAQLSKMARAPVRMILDRREEHTCVGNRPGTIQDLAIGAAADGALVAVDLTSHGTGGIAIGAGVGWASMRMYPAPNLRSRQHDVFMHAGPSAAFRAPGMPQGMFALEQSIDELAEKLALDPVALRDRLDVDRAGAPSTDPRSPLDPATAPPPPPGMPPPPAYDPKHPAIDRAARAIERRIGAERIGWTRRHAPGVGRGPVKRGLGMAQSLWGRFVDLDSHCEVRIARDGSIVLRSSVADIGTGTRTAAAMLLAEELGRDPDDVEVQIGDTRWPIGPSSGGSKTLASISPAIREAGAGARTRLVEAAARKLGVAPDKITVGRGTVGSLTWKQACAALPTEEIIVQGTRPPDWNGPPRGAIGGVQFADVSVDVETGEVRVIRIVAVHDCGRPINPLALQSQINGGILQGISWALYEDRRLDRETGRMLNPNLDQYRILGARETPYIDVILLEQYAGRSSTDVHGIGEPANVATAAAVANAIYNAIGVRIRELPITPQRILAALRGAP